MRNRNYSANSALPAIVPCSILYIDGDVTMCLVVPNPRWRATTYIREIVWCSSLFDVFRLVIRLLTLIVSKSVYWVYLTISVILLQADIFLKKSTSQNSLGERIVCLLFICIFVRRTAISTFGFAN